MCETFSKIKNTIIVFFPFEIEKIHKCYLFGDLDIFDGNIKVFFSTKLLNAVKPNDCISILPNSKLVVRGETKPDYIKNWIYLEVKQNVLHIKKFKIQGNFEHVNSYYILWINYSFSVFSQCEILTSDVFRSRHKDSYFKCFVDKIYEKVSEEEKRKNSSIKKTKNILLNCFVTSILKPLHCNGIPFAVTKYFNVALHINNFISGLVWAVKFTKRKRKIDVKVINLFLSLILDILLGIIFLNWLNSKVSLDSSPKLFLQVTETVVNSIKDLINWLRGDPAGLKLNRCFNKVLAIFFSFHIDIWWTFIAFLKPIVKIVFQIFLKLGLLGVTFQASIIADLLALVSFHVYCIYAYAAKLFSIQVSSLISLWRLFLGRKKNPLREKVDSCRYSPEQLFVGTLGFTILLFLLPTTLLYYIVFTSIRLVILMIGAVLILIRHLNQTLPVYSTILWVLRSPKISTGIQIVPYNGCLKSDFMILKLEPVIHSWWETINYFTPDCIVKPKGFNFSSFIKSIISGKLLFPIY